MKRSIFKGMMCLLLLGVGATSVYSQQRKDTLVVARDGTGDYRNIQEAVEAVRLHHQRPACRRSSYVHPVCHHLFRNHDHAVRSEFIRF